MNKVFAISLSAGFLIASLSAAYYLVVYIPQRDNRRLETQQRSFQTDNQNKIDKINQHSSCIENARKNLRDAAYDYAEEHCSGNLEECMVPKDTLTLYEDGFNRNVNICNDLYK